MADPNLRDFYGRLNRIETIHRHGGGFEAAGTLGMSYYTKMQRTRRVPVLKPMLLVAVAIVGLKGAIHARIGDEVYTSRISALSQGDGVDALGAFVMQADPLTKGISGFLAGFFE